MPSRTASASGWPGLALPQPGAGAERGQEQRGRVGPALGRGRGRELVRLRRCLLGGRLTAPAGQPPRPCSYPASPAAAVGLVGARVLDLVRSPGACVPAAGCRASGCPGVCWAPAPAGRPGRRTRTPWGPGAYRQASKRSPYGGSCPPGPEARTRVGTEGSRAAEGPYRGERGETVCGGAPEEPEGPEGPEGGEVGGGAVAGRRGRAGPGFQRGRAACLLGVRCQGGAGAGVTRRWPSPSGVVARDGSAPGPAEREPQRGLADPQQRAGGEPDRPGADLPAVDPGAVGGVEIGDAHAAVLADGDRAVPARDVGVVERDIGLRGAADDDAAAVQQMDPARVGPRHHVQPGRGRAVVGGLVLGRGREREHRAVHKRRLAEDAALGVEPVAAREQHHGGARDLGAGGGRREAGGDGRERRPRRGGDEHVTGARHSVAAARREDGQPDLHRLGGPFCAGVPRRGNSPVIPPTRHTIRAEGILAPATDNTPVAHLELILIGRLGDAKVDGKVAGCDRVGHVRRDAWHGRSATFCARGASSPKSVTRRPRERPGTREKSVNNLVAPSPRPAGDRPGAALEWAGNPTAMDASSRERMTCGR